jgi:hypothetical protein
MASCLRNGFNKQIFDAGYHLLKLVGLYLACEGGENPARILHAGVKRQVNDSRGFNAVV